jgi:hypothetical protein
MKRLLRGRFWSSIWREANISERVVLTVAPVVALGCFVLLVILLSSCAGQSWIGKPRDYQAHQQPAFLYHVSTKDHYVCTNFGCSAQATAWIRVYNATYRPRYTSVTCRYSVGKYKGSVTTSIFLLPPKSSRNVLVGRLLPQKTFGQWGFARCRDGSDRWSWIRKFKVK